VTGRPIALALRALGLGDFLTGLPALTILRGALPDHELVLAAPAPLAPLVALAPALDRLFAVGELQPLTEFRSPVQVGVDLHGKGPASRRLLEDLGPGRVVGFAHPPSDRPGPRWRRDEHEVARWCRLVAETFDLGKPYPPMVGTLRVPAAAVPTGVTMLHPGASAGARRWPADRFAAVGRELTQRGHDVVVTGNRAEEALASEVATAAGGRALLGLHITELAALVAGARLVVCGDTGVAHLASTYGTPSVVIYGPVPPAFWGPPVDGPHEVVWRGTGPGNSLTDQPDPALLAVSVDDVLDAVGRVRYRVAADRSGARGGATA
jgi:ADP-heptose:LPS heptosyltransferase